MLTVAFTVVASATSSTTADAHGFAGDMASPRAGHDRPARYNKPGLTRPPVVQYMAAEYPRAVGFVPVHSSNYTPDGIESYDYVVVHTMQGTYAGSMSWFQNPTADVSAHYCMRAEDGEVTQMVRNQDRAWHVSSANSRALGIEHEGWLQDPEQWFTWVNYVESAYLARWLCDTYNIPIDRDHVVGHVEVPGNTHTDPGPHWNWDAYMGLIKATVPEATVEAIVVDSSRACTITTTQDTVLKRSTEDSGRLSSVDVCPVSAGTEISVLYEFEGFDRHRSMRLAGDDACAATFETDAVYLFAEHGEGECDNPTIANADVLLDDETSVTTDADGIARFVNVGSGAHELTVMVDGEPDAREPFELDVHPGARIIIPLGETPSGGDGDGGTDPDLGEGEKPEDSSSGGEETDGADTFSLPGGFGVSGESGCSCRSSKPNSSWVLTMLLLGLGGVARRRSSLVYRRPKPRNG